jgi:hypothetical protein
MGEEGRELLVSLLKMRDTNNLSYDRGALIKILLAGIYLFYNH